ncbi:hypothetical protein BDV28DRAFT_67707 [Aspergillus coremiiformis]|uniref:Uncharacterized protein n=1 Tax=Aspergillus coremiiformis TaxID=138285 RepID=A0A5N6YUH7_9EURO|nr:hypothetical protein BDV28DRAFT_67707 [Aspergillus coremiiformis]
MQPSASSFQNTNNDPRAQSPSSMNLRHRGSARSATFAESCSSNSNLQNQRRNSTFSDSVSEARNSIRSSTDDLFFPRVAKRSYDPTDVSSEESHWHSAPLGLALLPAIAGVFFQNGSAVVTDVTLLILAAIFLNWSVRLPWDWYRSAQAIRQDNFSDAIDTPVLDIEIDQNDQPQESKEDSKEDPNSADSNLKERTTDVASAASRELQLHEIAALASCFVFPLIGTWLLHAIRSKLSRPSEGLVSNYNLTIFLLASEIRPFAHLLKMVQARTLHLQRIVATPTESPKDRIDASKILDLSKRLEELEAYVSETAAVRLATESLSQEHSQPHEQDYTQSLVSQTTAEVRKWVQPDIDALNRAVRRFEKRTTMASAQTDSRLETLETQVQDAISLAAAAQRSTTRKHRGFLFVLFEWPYAAALLPAQIFMSIAVLPFQMTRWCLRYIQDLLFSKPPPKTTMSKTPQDSKARLPKRTKRVSQQEPAETKALKPIREFP